MITQMAYATALRTQILVVLALMDIGLDNARLSFSSLSRFLFLMLKELNLIKLSCLFNSSCTKRLLIACQIINCISEAGCLSQYVNLTSSYQRHKSILASLIGMQ